MEKVTQKGVESDAETVSSADTADDTPPEPGRRRGRGRGGPARRGSDDSALAVAQAAETSTETEAEAPAAGRGRGRGRGRGHGRGGRGGTTAGRATLAAAAAAAPDAAYLVPADFDPGLLSGADFSDKKSAAKTVPEVFFRRWRTLRAEVHASLASVMQSAT